MIRFPAHFIYSPLFNYTPQPVPTKFFQVLPIHPVALAIQSFRGVSFKFSPLAPSLPTNYDLLRHLSHRDLCLFVHTPGGCIDFHREREDTCDILSQNDLSSWRVCKMRTHVSTSAGSVYWEVSLGYFLQGGPLFKFCRLSQFTASCCGRC